MTIDEVKAILRDAHVRIGCEGRFALTLNLQPEEECYITHWFRPTPYAFEDCRAVGVGTLADCLDALERYVQGYRRRPTEEEVGRTLGVDRCAATAGADYEVAAE